jgi:DNA methylase
VVGTLGIPWVRPNFAPAPVGDRPVHAWEHVLLLSKSAWHHFDAAALRERSVDRRQRPGRNVWTIRPLAARCILAGSPPGSWVLGFCAGSGTTGMAAVQHGRNAAPIELDEGHADTTRRRLGDRLIEEGPSRGAADRQTKKAR